MAMSKDTKTRPYSIKVLKVLVGTIFLLFCFHLILQYLNWLVFYQQNGQVYELANRFDLDDEASFPTWFSQLLFLFIAFGSFAAAYLQPKKHIRRLWLIIGAIGLAFSIDEIAGFHEFILQTLHVIFFKDAGPTEVDNAWLLVLPFVLAIALWLCWKIWKILPKRTFLVFVIAGAVFLSGAIGVDLLTSITERESFVNQGILTGLEEMLELLASAVVVYAIVEYLERNHSNQMKHVAQEIKKAGQQNLS